MTPPVISQSEAWEIAHQFAKDVEAIVGDHLIAVVVVGSLAAGHYVPGRSDIDLIVVTGDECPDEPIAAIARLADQYWKRYGFRNGFGGYGVRLCDLRPPFGVLHNEVYEILQIKRRGRVISGQLDLSQISEPSPEDIRRSLADLIPDMIGAHGPDGAPSTRSADAWVNTILGWMRLLVWDRTGDYVLDKRGTLGAFANLAEATLLMERLGSVAAYVHQTQDDPGPVDVLCREVEMFVLDRVAWARQAASAYTDGSS